MVGKIWYFLFVLQYLKEVDMQALRVTNLLPNESELCFIEEHIMVVEETSVGCVALCKAKPPCLLACKIGNRCRLYSTNVSPHFMGVIAANQILSSAKCHSIWAEKGDFARTAALTSSVIFGGSLLNIVSGYSCNKFNDYNVVLKRDLETNEWIMADFGVPKWVDKVIIQTRGAIIEGFENYFTNVSVRVGNVQGNGYFGANELLMTYGGPATYGAVVTFQKEKPLLGRFVSVQRTIYDNFAFMEMKIVSPYM